MAGPDDEARDAYGKWTAGGGGLDPTKQPGIQGVIARADKATHPVSSGIERLGISGQPFAVAYRNPSADHLLAFMAQRNIQVARGLVSPSTGDAFWWDAGQADHEDAAFALALPSDASARLILKDRTIYHAPFGTGPTTAVLAESRAITSLTAGGKFRFTASRFE